MEETPHNFNKRSAKLASELYLTKPMGLKLLVMKLIMGDQPNSKFNHLAWQ